MSPSLANDCQVAAREDTINDCIEHRYEKYIRSIVDVAYLSGFSKVEHFFGSTGYPWMSLYISAF